MALTPVDPREIATIVTHLEMRERPRPAPIPPAPLRLVPWKTPDLAAYRALFRRVGEPWLWFSRLVMPDDQLAAILHDPLVEVYAVTDPRGVEVGLLELDFRSPSQCELAFFGLVPSLNGKGLGKWLMAQAKSLAWRKGVERFWVHTCTLDSPAALGFYIKSGFTPYGREIETFADPRLLGLLPPEAAPQIPMFGQPADA
ncbi:MAG: GNAT family N-acetyltransferase [Pseudomonadota bacterium]|mgnify:FL=1|jgi:GNAT superfamily N-acetyltransferase|uniref:GNAT family N-acetyltransferase n=1 Tax=Sphingobium yanoikuyae TaxID=13690 RepID=A0A430BZJ2_SPHYA|nr:GNAT family N-acetyltransferase [Sphingobium yanoikuyae]NBB39324.1 GNAT family N-acetyltransferase [Sphingobium yanoikuyae]RSU58120.1 GNAT family N-acetyltransferase [Sphingobium yanoikuyae]RSU76611.1 GNAT family N-acetyltransferase [Sphingomonas sp. S-NIH.Pt3_0716]